MPWRRIPAQCQEAQLHPNPPHPTPPHATPRHPAACRSQRYSNFGTVPTHRLQHVQTKQTIMSFRLSKRPKTVQLFTTVRDLASCSVQPPNQTRQALAPSALMLLCSKLMLVIELLPCKTSAKAWQKQQRRPSRFNQAWTPETGESGGIWGNPPQRIKTDVKTEKPRCYSALQHIPPISTPSLQEG